MDTLSLPAAVIGQFLSALESAYMYGNRGSCTGYLKKTIAIF